MDFIPDDASGMMRRFMQARLYASRERSEEDETVLGLALDEWAAHVRGEGEGEEESGRGIRGGG